MEDPEIRQMAEMERVYWWHQGKRRIVEAFLKQYWSDSVGSILDYGCGTGENLQLMQKYGRVSGVDTSEEAVQICRDKGLSDVKRIEPGDNLGDKYDLITSLDLLEHVRDDIALLEKFRGMLTERGRLLVMVPAYRFLWSEHDEALCHFRRYIASELRAKLTMAGFNVIRVTYAVTIVFLPIVLYRLWRGFFPKSYEKPKVSYVLLPGPVNEFLYQLLLFESKMLRHFNLPFGCSIVALAENKSN